MILDFAGNFYSKLSPFHDFSREFAKFLLSPNLPRPYLIDFSNNMAAVDRRALDFDLYMVGCLIKKLEYPNITLCFNSRVLVKAWQ